VDDDGKRWDVELKRVNCETSNCETVVSPPSPPRAAQRAYVWSLKTLSRSYTFWTASGQCFTTSFLSLFVNFEEIVQQSGKYIIYNLLEI